MMIMAAKAAVSLPAWLSVCRTWKNQMYHDLRACLMDCRLPMVDG